jgi:hypothetical protein
MFLTISFAVMDGEVKKINSNTETKMKVFAAIFLFHFHFPNELCKSGKL